MSTRNGMAAVGSLGFGGAVVVVVAPAATTCFGLVFGVSLCGPLIVSPPVPTGCWLERPVSDTMCESCRSRLSVATGPTTSRLAVRRDPTGETCALCWSVGANSTNHTTKASTPKKSTGSTAGEPAVERRPSSRVRRTRRRAPRVGLFFGYRGRRRGVSAHQNRSR